MTPVIVGAIIEFVTTAIGVCLAPRGTALIAVGIALRMLERKVGLMHFTKG